MNSPMLRDPLRSARMAVQRGRFRDAMTQLTTLKQQWEHSPEWLLLVAMASWRLGDFADSRRLAEHARDQYRTRGDTDGEMRAQNVSAAGAFALGRLDSARDGFERAASLARGLSNTLMMARCANNIGNVDYHLGNNNVALVLYRSAAGLFEQAGSLRGVAETWHNVGTVLREEGALSAALHATDRAVEVAERLADDRLVGQMLGGRGESDALLGDLRLGKVEVTRALEIARAHDDRLSECQSLKVLGFIARMDDAMAESLRFCEMARDVARKIENHWMLAKTGEALGETLLAASRPSEAVRCFADAAHAYAAIGATIRSDRARVRAATISES